MPRPCPVPALCPHGGFLGRFPAHLKGAGRNVLADRIAAEVIEREVYGLPNIDEGQIAGVDDQDALDV
jgi:hypothetical protein